MKIKELWNKLQTVIYLITFSVIYLLSFLIIFKPSVSNLLALPYVKFDAVRLVIVSIYPVMFLALYSIIVKVKKNLVDKLIIFSTFLMSAAVIVLNIIFNYLESINYPNYVYSKFHLYLPYLSQFSTFQTLLVFLAVILFFNRMKIVNSIFTLSRKNELIKLLVNTEFVVALITLIIISSFVPVFVNMSVYEVKMFIRSNFSNLDYRFRTVDLWDVGMKMDFVAKNIPENSSVLLPPQTWDFPEIGNQVLVRYYLFPRVLISPKRVDLYLKDHGGNCELYSLLGEKGNHKLEYFPETDFKNVNIIIRNKDGKIFDFKNINYDDKFRKTLKGLEIGVIKYNKCSL